MTFSGQIQFLAFNIFEGCVGLFWPSMMKVRAPVVPGWRDRLTRSAPQMRSQYVPEDVRSTIMNMFRIPLNLFVCVILYNVSLFPIWMMFSMCGLFLLAAALAQRKLERITSTAASAGEKTQAAAPASPRRGWDEGEPSVKDGR